MQDFTLKLCILNQRNVMLSLHRLDPDKLCTRTVRNFNPKSINRWHVGLSLFHHNLHQVFVVFYKKKHCFKL